LQNEIATVACGSLAMTNVVCDDVLGVCFADSTTKLVKFCDLLIEKLLKAHTKCEINLPVVGDGAGLDIDDVDVF
jgi:hypothetical protein